LLLDPPLKRLCNSWPIGPCTPTGRTNRDWASETPVARAIEGIVGIRRGEDGAAALLEEAWREIEPVPESSPSALQRCL
jgi:hypothetical protein